MAKASSELLFNCLLLENRIVFSRSCASQKSMEKRLILISNAILLDWHCCLYGIHQWVVTSGDAKIPKQNHFILRYLIQVHSHLIHFTVSVLTFCWPRKCNTLFAFDTTTVNDANEEFVCGTKAFTHSPVFCGCKQCADTNNGRTTQSNTNKKNDRKNEKHNKTSHNKVYFMRWEISMRMRVCECKAEWFDPVSL